MKLVSIRIQNYKCIEDSGEFTVKKLTCLAGKNESGKSALLQALRRLNPVEETDQEFNVLMEYPRRKLSGLSEEDAEQAEVLVIKCELSDDDLVDIEENIAPGVIRDRRVIVKLGYSNVREWDFEFDKSKIIPFLVSKISEISEDLKRDALGFSTLQELYDDLKSEDELNDGQRELLELLENDFPNNDPHLAISRLLDNLLPRFIYFSKYETLQGKVSANEILSMIGDESSPEGSERIFLALFDLAQTDIMQLQNAQGYEARKVIEERLSNRLTDTIRKYWHQNQDLKVVLTRDDADQNDRHPFNSGHVFHLRVENLPHQVSVDFDERSAGFVWFFSFLVRFSQMKRIYGDKLVILLDEPGLSLHGKAQNDLLGYIKEDLLPKYQVIYTTHSPFMIDPNNILSVRTVEDVTEDGEMLGTKVSDRPLKADAQTLFPIRAALGYGITQSLFIGEHCLLVEGKSDKLYLQWFSKRLKKQGRTGLDPRWVITPVNGIDNIQPFIHLFSGNELDVAVLTDFHSKVKSKVNNLRESKLLVSERVFSADQFAEQEEADIEDMIGSDFYFGLVNRCYGLEGAEMIQTQETEGHSIRVVKEVEDYFNDKLKQDFRHPKLAPYLIEHEGEFQDVNGLCTALKRFEQFFKKVNALLPCPVDSASRPE